MCVPGCPLSVQVVAAAVPAASCLTGCRAQVPHIAAGQFQQRVFTAREARRGRGYRSSGASWPILRLMAQGRGRTCLRVDIEPGGCSLAKCGPPIGTLPPSAMMQCSCEPRGEKHAWVGVYAGGSRRADHHTARSCDGQMWAEPELKWSGKACCHMRSA